MMARANLAREQIEHAHEHVHHEWKAGEGYVRIAHDHPHVHTSKRAALYRANAHHRRHSNPVTGKVHG